VKFTPILVAKPSDEVPAVRTFPKGPYPHIQAEAVRPEAMMWGRWSGSDGGRGFGFTGGHFHDNWGTTIFARRC